MMTFAEYREDTFPTELEDIYIDQEDLTEASFRNLSAAAALAIAMSQRKKVISKIREAKKPTTPIEDKLDLPTYLFCQKFNSGIFARIR